MNKPDRPRAVDAEASLLGSMLLDPTILGKFELPAADLYDDRHIWIYSAIRNLRAASADIDYITVKAELERSGKWKDIGGMAYLNQLLTIVPDAAHFQSYVDLIRDASDRRTLADVSTELAGIAYDGSRKDRQAAIDRQIARLQGKDSGNPKEPRFEVFTGPDALKPRDPAVEVIKKLARVPSVSLFVGAHGTVKTWSLLDLIVAVEKGERWLDFETVSCPVLWVDEESGKDRLKDRLADVLRAHASEGTAIYCTKPKGLALLREDEQRALLELVQEKGAGLVVVDALIDCLVPDGDENSSVDMQTVFAALRRIAEEARAAIFVIHHENKVGSYRGSSAMAAAVDLLVGVEWAQASRRVTFRTLKARDLEPLSFAAIANWGPGTFNLSQAQTIERQPHFSKGENFVLRFLGDNGDSPLDAIMANADTCSASAAKHGVYSLVERGRVRRTNPGAKGASAIYGLIEVPKLSSSPTL